MLRVATFSRTSTDNLSQSKSIGNQEDIYKIWIEKNNCQLYKNYIDEGISGTKGRYRTEWKKLIEDGKNNKFDILLSKSFSRFGRNQIETLTAIRELREVGVRIVFIEDNLDSMKDTSNFGLFSWLAEIESKKTSERIKTVFKNYREQGKIFSCTPPWGYDYSPELKKFVINEEEAPIIQRIFRLYLLGNGTNKIANILTAEGIRGKNGGVIRGGTIKNIIINEVYIGTLVQGKSEGIDVTISKRNSISEDNWIRHFNKHDAIIDSETFIKANKIFKRNSENSYKIRYSVKGIERASNASLFSNLIVCSDCGSTVSIRRKKDKKLFYNCVNYERKGRSCGHRSNKVDEDFLIEFVIFRLNKLVEKNFEDIDIKNDIDIKKELQKQLEKNDKAINEQMKKTRNLMELYNQQIISENQMRLENEFIKNTLDTLLITKEELKEKIKNVPEENKAFKKDVETILKTNAEHWSNAMLKKVIKKIYVGTNGVISIKWAIQN